MLHELDDGLWVVEESLELLGTEIGRVMTVVALPDGGVLVHSPARLTDRRRRRLDELGGVRAVVPASKLHGHLYMEQYREAYPDAKLLAAPGLDHRRKDLAFDGLLGDEPDPLWADAVDQTGLLGHRLGIEIEFFHTPSGTLILGDLCYRVTDEFPLKSRLLARLARMYGRLSVPPDLKATIANEAAFRQSVERLFDWEFDRVIVGHGSIVESGARRELRDALSWALD